MKEDMECSWFRVTGGQVEWHAVNSCVAPFAAGGEACGYQRNGGVSANGVGC